MRAFVQYVAVMLAATVAIAAVCTLGGALFALFRAGTSYAGAIGWAMWIGGGLLALVTGQSGSPSQMARQGRWGSFGHYWGGNSPLPESPLWIVAASMLVVGLGVLVYFEG